MSEEAKRHDSSSGGMDLAVHSLRRALSLLSSASEATARAALRHAGGPQGRRSKRTFEKETHTHS